MVNGNSANGITPEEAIPQLSDLMRSLRSFNPSDPSSVGDIAQLLKSIEQADGIAQGVETRLDSLLEDLEGMIGGLETSLGDKPVEGGQGNVEQSRDVTKTSQADDRIDGPSMDEAGC